MLGTANTNFGVKGTSETFYGVFGQSTSGIAGVAGTSPNIGVYGVTTGRGAGSGIGAYGNVTGANSIGAYGRAGTGVGVGAFSDRGIALGATSSFGRGILLFLQGSGTGLRTFSGSTPQTGGNAALFAQGSLIAFKAGTVLSGYPLIL